MGLLELMLAPFIIFVGVLIAVYLVTIVLVAVPMTVLMGIGIYLGLKEKQLQHTEDPFELVYKRINRK